MLRVKGLADTDRWGDQKRRIRTTMRIRAKIDQSMFTYKHNDVSPNPKHDDNMDSKHQKVIIMTNS